MLNPKVTVIILNWNRLKDTIECLGAVQKSNYSNFEIVVVDNASTDGSQEIILQKFSDIRLIRNSKNLGFAGGCNRGIEYAMKNGADYIWLLNNDAIVEPDTLSELILLGESEERIGLVSPVIHFCALVDSIQHCGAIIDNQKYCFKNFRNLDEIKKCADKNIYLYGTALLIKRKVIESVGYLNEDYFSYVEDMEYSFRSLNFGYFNKVALTAKIFHKEHNLEEGDIDKLPHYFFYYTSRNEFFFWKKNTKGTIKIKFMIRYLITLLRRIGYCHELSYYGAIDACFDGLYCAIRNIKGPWNKTSKMPSIIRKIISWHPYFLANILEFNLSLFSKK